MGSNVKLCFVDVETSGLDPQKNALLQVSGIVRVEGKPEETFNLCIKPFTTDVLDAQAMQINGLDPIKGLEPLAAHNELVKLFSKYVSKYNRQDKMFFVGYNAGFDMDFMRAFFIKCNDKFFGSFFFYPYIDVMQMALMRLLDRRPSMENFKLSCVCKAVGLQFDMDKAHSAAYDVLQTKELFDRIVNKEYTSEELNLFGPNTPREFFHPPELWKKFAEDCEKVIDASSDSGGLGQDPSAVYGVQERDRATCSEDACACEQVAG